MIVADIFTEEKALFRSEKSKSEFFAKIGQAKGIVDSYTLFNIQMYTISKCVFCAILRVV